MAYHITYRTGVTFYGQKNYNLRNLIQVKKIIKNIFGGGWYFNFISKIRRFMACFFIIV